jgi:ribonuclease R
MAKAGKHKTHEHAVTGLLRVHPAGYGFVQRDDGEEDVFVAARGRGAALDGDRVRVMTFLGLKGTEGRVVEVLARGRARVSGTIGLSPGPGRRRRVLLPDDPRLLVQSEYIELPEGAGPAKGGQAVVAEITRYPETEREPICARVLRVLGAPEEVGTEIAKILLCADLPDEFPEEVLRAADQVEQALRPESLADRIDLRDRPFVTIDPVDARDFDDAVCVEPGLSPGIDRLWVAVADVSHYVAPGTALDREARVRGCSVYLPDRVLPMLPLPLSSGICSLRPEVDRLAMVAALDIDRHGEVRRSRLQAAVIRSHGRLDYEGVAAALEGDLRGAHARYKEHLPQLKLLSKVAGRLRARRLGRGALDLDLPEAKVVLDESGQVVDVVRARQEAPVRAAYGIVEDCMIAANEAVARFFSERGLPAVYRIHDVPDDERLVAFAALARGHGLLFDARKARSPKYLKAFLEQLKGRPMEQALSYLLLRALRKAQYAVGNVGHFGLASADYLHFTSPIRRYPDLVVHRLLKAHLRREGEPAGGLGPPPPPPAEELGQQAQESSLAERRAMEVEREVVDLYRALLMQDQVGQEYDGTVVGVTAFGIFVALDEPFVEGLIRSEQLPGDFEFDEQTVRLQARKGGAAIALGDRVRVRVAGVSITRRKINLELIMKQKMRGRKQSPQA